MKGFWGYQAPEPPPAPESYNAQDWESLSPGMRREIVRTQGTNNMDFEAILTAAHTAAELATKAEQERLPEDETAFDCGFAWVTIEGNSPLARHCRKNLNENVPAHQLKGDREKYGDKGYPKGWQFWKPGKFRGQSVRIHRAGANAFSEELAKHNIRADVGSRYD